MELGNEDNERAALGLLFSTYADDVYRFVLARCGSSSLADEVTSDVFADAARLFAAHRGDEIQIGWLIATARRRLIDRWRAHERQRERLRRLRQERDRVDVLSSWTATEPTLRALRSLPERQRAALTLRYLDAYSVTEVAETLDCSYRAAESLLSRARRSFAKAYQETV